MAKTRKSEDGAEREMMSGASAGRSQSYWMEAEAPALRPLRADRETDVCVIGAGIAGLSAAWHLLARGRRVLVLDDGPIGGGESARTTAHVTRVLDTRYHELDSRFGEGVTRLAAASHGAAIETLAEIVAREGLECDFARVPGYLFQADVKSDELEKELEALGRLGVEGRLETRMPWSSAPSWPALVFPDQAQIHLGKFLPAFARVIEAAGGEIFTGTRAESIEGEGPLRVKTPDGHTIEAADVVHATHVPMDAPATIYLKEFPYRTYVVAGPVPKGRVPFALFWDTEDPYHYARLQPRERDDLLIVGGEDHPTGKADDAGERLARIEQWTRERFPEMGPVEYRWSGQIFEPVDGLGLIGRHPEAEHQYVITGCSGNGVTYGVLGGRLVADLIAGEDNPWAGVYDPKRIPKAVKSLVSMAIPAAKGYTRTLTAGRRHDRDRPGHGRIVREEGQKVARYRGTDGGTLMRSAVCTHRGCIVDWNDFEQTWDCRCHGSRFAPNGEVLTGPATKPLEAFEPGRTHAGKKEKEGKEPASRDD